MIISIIIFILVLSLLVLVHELGHFMVAKWTGMRVDEFGIGFPPHLWKKTYGETTYCINAIPMGGYVKIHGESGEEEEGEPDPRSFTQKPVYKRIMVILAGVFMNALFAFVVLSIAFTIGFMSFSQSINEIPGATATNSRLVIAQVLKDSPAAKAEFKPGDIITAVKDNSSGEVTSISGLSQFQDLTTKKQQEGSRSLSITVRRDDSVVTKDVSIRAEGYPLGVALESLDTIKVPWYRAPAVAAKEMGYIVEITWNSLRDFFARLFVHAELDQNVSGPVGIYQATASAAQQGVAQVVFLMVVLSINLALLNVLPIPALDGGKFVFLMTELIFRKRIIAQKIENALSLAGFAFLIGLIAVITVRDVIRLF